MSNIELKNSKEILEKLIQEAKKHKSGSELAQFEQFLNYYYNFIAYDDLVTQNLFVLYELADKNWQLIQDYKKNDVVINLFNTKVRATSLNENEKFIQVVCPDLPFLIDSIRLALIKKQFQINFILNPGSFAVDYDKDDRIKSVNFDNPTQANLAVFLIEVEGPASTKEEHFNLHDYILDVIKQVQLIVTAWQPMLEQLEKTIKLFEPIKAEKETINFLKWLFQENFIHLGYLECHYSLKEKKLSYLDSSRLGLCNEKNNEISSYLTTKNLENIVDATKETMSIYQLPMVSNIHRRTSPYLLTVKVPDTDKKHCKILFFVGLLSAEAYHASILRIPFLSNKVFKLRNEAHIAANSHAWRQVLSILQNYPRDELFLAPIQYLKATIVNIYNIQERNKIRMFVRKESIGKYYSVLIYIPKDNYNSIVRKQIIKILQDTFNLTDITFNTFFSESILARMHVLLRFDKDDSSQVDLKKLEEKIVKIACSWDYLFSSCLSKNYDYEQAKYLYNKYLQAFSPNYRNLYSIETTVCDIKYLEQLNDDEKVAVRLYKPLDALEYEVYVKIYFYKELAALSDILPIIENFGFNVIDEKTYHITLSNDESAWVCDLRMTSQNFKDVNVQKLAGNFEDTFLLVWENRIENDAFNKLVVFASIHWSEIILLRAYAKFMKQICLPFSQSYIENCLKKYPNITKKIVDFFTLKFSGKTRITQEQVKQVKEDFLNLLDRVLLLDDDRVLRQYFELIEHTLRTNFYSRQSKDNALIFKFNSAEIKEVPLPKPEYEFFVYSAELEGVHLRTSKVARGGLRWSDRKEDYRTEILGLMKAQQVKNAAIVPSGAKGGFIVKSLLEQDNNNAVMTKVKQAYSAFISSLLSLEDNLVGETVVKPENVLCYDKTDTYLVVAADKGTATFSDIANNIAIKKDFWLNDAFASGGSIGYDHKAMGITAKSAWESVTQHCLSLGFSPQEEEFTVVGIGDMSGDVFGNGMLLSKKIKLVAAFNHKHIFIDPNPNAEKSYNERKRLFNLPRSSWEDYNKKLISTGGGVFTRSSKSLQLSNEIKTLLEISESELSPNQLIKKLLQAKVTLLWSAGIGTYVKATAERNQDVGDKANDLIRINGFELNAKIVGEGGNLGLTQLGRVEYALSGGLCFTDFIDNVGGVDCSDHEVNIKIFLNVLCADGRLSEDKRNKLLASMQDDVSKMVLTNSYRQAKSLNYCVYNANKKIEEYIRVIDYLESIGYLDRQLEFIPSNEEMLNRKTRDIGLTRPELAVIFAYTKNLLKKELRGSALLEDPYVKNMIYQCFPTALQDKYYNELSMHPLRNDIIIMELSNQVINLMGPTFLNRLYDETGASVEKIISCYLIASELFKVNQLIWGIDKLDHTVDYKVKMKLQSQLIRLVRRAVRWLVKNNAYECKISDYVNQYSNYIHNILFDVESLLAGEKKKIYRDSYQEYIDEGIPRELAVIAADNNVLISILDIVHTVITQKIDLNTVATTYFFIGRYLQLDWLRSVINEQKVINNWDMLARAAFKDDIDTLQIYFTEKIIEIRKQSDKNIRVWMRANKVLIDRWFMMLSDLKNSKVKKYTMFSVTLRELKLLANQSFHNQRR